MREDLENATRDQLLDKIDGLEADLESAVCVAFSRGAITWTRMNYPRLYARLMEEHRAAQDGGTVVLGDQP